MSDWNRPARLLALCASLLGVAAPAQALLISVQFAFPGERSLLSSTGRFGNAGSLAGGGTVEGVFAAAAQTWEGLLHDTRTVGIKVGWAELPPGVIAAAAPIGLGGNEILLNNRNTRHFADPTPLDASEFGSFDEVLADLGGGPIVVGREYGNPLFNLPGIDLLSTALHEIGHVLGLPLDQPGGLQTFLITEGPFAGTALPCVQQGICAHLSLQSALMSTFVGLDSRTLVSGADLLFVAADGGYRDIDLSAVGSAAVPEPASAWLSLAGLAALGSLRRRSRPPAG